MKKYIFIIVYFKIEILIPGSLNVIVCRMWIATVMSWVSLFESHQHIFFQNCSSIHWPFCAVKPLLCWKSFFKPYNLAGELQILYFDFIRILSLNSYQMANKNQNQTARKLWGRWSKTKITTKTLVLPTIVSSSKWPHCSPIFRQSYCVWTATGNLSYIANIFY